MARDLEPTSVFRDELGTEVDLLIERRRYPRGFWESVLRADPCSYCRSKAGSGVPCRHYRSAEGTIDHIFPRAKGAEYAPSRNCTGVCNACNERKDDMKLLEFLLVRDRPRRRRRRNNPRQKSSSFFSPEQLEQMMRAAV